MQQAHRMARWALILGCWALVSAGAQSAAAGPPQVSAADQVRLRRLQHEIALAEAKLKQAQAESVALAAERLAVTFHALAEAGLNPDLWSVVWQGNRCVFRRLSPGSPAAGEPSQPHGQGPGHASRPH